MKFLQNKIKLLYIFLLRIRYEVKTIITHREIDNLSSSIDDIKKYRIDNLKQQLAMGIVNNLPVEEVETIHGIELRISISLLDLEIQTGILNQLKLMNDYINNHDKEFIELTDENESV